MLTHTSRWSHAPGNRVVPSRWQATQCSPLARGESISLTRLRTGLVCFPLVRGESPDVFQWQATVTRSALRASIGTVGDSLLTG